MPSIMAPARVMASALLLAFALLAAAVGVATWQPWLSLQLRVVAPPGLDAEAGHIEVLGATRASPAASMPAHARIVGIAPLDADGRLGPVMALQGDDLLEEPDVLDSYAEMRYDTSQRLERAGLQFDWQLDASTVHRLDLDARHQYQIHALVHEAVSNSMRHVVASRVSISLSCEHGHLHLCIGDDGAGFDPTQINQGQGLRNMRARAQALGGEVHWRSRSVLAQDRATTTMSTPGVGTLVEISWPVLQRTG